MQVLASFMAKNNLPPERVKDWELINSRLVSRINDQ